MIINSVQPKSIAGTLLPAVLLTRTVIDGSLNYSFRGITLTQAFGLTLFAYTLFIFLTKFRFGAISLLIISALLSVSCLSAINNWGVLARDELVRTVGIFGIYLIAVNSRSEKSSNYFYQSLRLTASLCSFFALYQLINQTGGIYVNGTWRYSGFMHSPNTAAILYAAYLIAECTIFKNSKSRLRIVTIGLSLAGLVLTLSVGGFIFLGLGMSITLGLRNERDRFNKVLVFVVTSTTSLVAAYFLISSVRAKINLSFLPVFSQSADARSSLQWRFDTWRTFVNYWLDKPLFGQGFGSTRNLNMAGKYMPHDEYLRLLVEVGVVGIVIFSVTYLSTLAKILKIQRALKDPLSLYTSAIMIVMLVNAISENTFTYTVPEYILAASIGFALSRSRRLNSNLVKSRNSFEHRINMSGNEAYSFRKLMEK